jgi:hypothetical protein
MSATAMAPYLDPVERLLIKALLKEGFETMLMALAASSSVRVVQRIHRNLEMPTPKTKSVGRRSPYYLTHAKSPL